MMTSQYVKNEWKILSRVVRKTQHKQTNIFKSHITLLYKCDEQVFTKCFLWRILIAQFNFSWKSKMNKGPISFIANLVSKAAWPAISIQWHTSLAFKALPSLHICMLICYIYNKSIEYEVYTFKEIQAYWCIFDNTLI